MRGKHNILAVVMLLTIALTSIGLVGGAGSEGTKVLIEPNVVYANPGETFWVDVNIEKVTDLYAYEFKIGYVSGTKVVGAVDAEGNRYDLTNLFDPPYFLYGPEEVEFSFFIEPMKGYIHVGATILGDYNGLSGAGTLAKVQFAAVEAGESDLHLYDVKLLDHNLDEMETATRDSYVDGVNAELVMINIGARTKDVGDTQTFDVKVHNEDQHSAPLNVRARLDNVRDDGYTMTIWAGQSYVFPPIREPEVLYVDGFTADDEEWNEYGTSPYLGAEEDGNYIEASGCADGAKHRFFTFPDIALEGAVVDYVQLEAYTDGPYDADVDYDLMTPDGAWLGSLYGNDAPGWQTPRWVGTYTTSDLYDMQSGDSLLDEEPINNLSIEIDLFDPLGHGGAGCIVDAMRITVYFKAGRAPEPLVVDGFTADDADWNEYGTSPYLGAEEDGSYIEASGCADGDRHRFFTFEDVALEGSVVDYVQLEAYTDGPYDPDVDYDLLTPDGAWLGSLYGMGEPGWQTPRWVGTYTTSDLYDLQSGDSLLDEEPINNLSIEINFFDPLGHGGAGCIVDAMRITVYFKAERVVLPRDPPVFTVQPGEVLWLNSTIWGLEPEDAGSYECTVTLQYSYFEARFNEATKHVITESWRCRPPE